MRKYILPFAAAVTMLAGAALAQSPPSPQDAGRAGSLREACKAEIAQHCTGIEAGGGRRVACLVEKKAQLSPACQSALEQRKDGRGSQTGVPETAPGTKRSDTAAAPAGEPAAAPRKGKGKGNGRMAACRTDVATFCQDTAKGGGQRMACLQQNVEKLDPACRAALSERKVQAKGQRQACRDDRKSLCGDVQAGGGKIVQCLKSNADKLSPGCKDVILR